MIVTSDVFDVVDLNKYAEIDWSENLLCGVGVHGQNWRSIEAGANFLVEAAQQSGLMDEMRWASYYRRGETHTHPLAPKSLIRVRAGKLAGARDSIGLLLRGERQAKGTREGTTVFGGLVNGPMSRGEGFFADFVLPVGSRQLDDTCDLLRLAASVLGADYGYSFVRDDFCYPIGYCDGLRGVVYPAAEAERLAADEIPAWANFVHHGGLQGASWPLLRDLFEANLISERHTAAPVEGLGYLLDWIGDGCGRGRLEQLGDGRWLWILTDEEVFDTRPQLYDAGLLFTYEKRVYRDLGRETERRPPKRLSLDR